MEAPGWRDIDGGTWLEGPGCREVDRGNFIERL
jgi:hypothetical protein